MQPPDDSAHENLYLSPSTLSFQLFLLVSQALLLSSQMRQSSVDGTPADELTSLRFTIIATWAMALLAVYLRFLARRLSKAGLWCDDWLMIPATVSVPHVTISSSRLLRWSKRMMQAHISVSSLPLYFASIWQPGVCPLDCTNCREIF